MRDFSKMSDVEFDNHMEAAENRLARRNPGCEETAAEVAALKAELKRRGEAKAKAKVEAAAKAKADAAAKAKADAEAKVQAEVEAKAQAAGKAAYEKAKADSAKAPATAGKAGA